MLDYAKLLLISKNIKYSKKQLLTVFIHDLNDRQRAFIMVMILLIFLYQNMIA